MVTGKGACDWPEVLLWLGVGSRGNDRARGPFTCTHSTVRRCLLKLK